MTKKTKVYTLIRSNERYIFYENKKLKTKYAPVPKWLHAKPKNWVTWTLMCQNPAKVDKHPEIEAYLTLGFMHKDYVLLAFMNKDEEKKVSFLTFNDEVRDGVNLCLQNLEKNESFKGICSNCGTQNVAHAIAPDSAIVHARKRFGMRTRWPVNMTREQEILKEFQEKKLSAGMTKMGKPEGEDKAHNEETSAKTGKP